MRVEYKEVNSHQDYLRIKDNLLNHILSGDEISISGLKSLSQGRGEGATWYGFKDPCEPFFWGYPLIYGWCENYYTALFTMGMGS